MVAAIRSARSMILGNQTCGKDDITRHAVRTPFEAPRTAITEATRSVS
jgi:hypothetical protein